MPREFDTDHSAGPIVLPDRDGATLTLDAAERVGTIARNNKALPLWQRSIWAEERAHPGNHKICTIQYVEWRRIVEIVWAELVGFEQDWRNTVSAEQCWIEPRTSLLGAAVEAWQVWSCMELFSFQEKGEFSFLAPSGYPVELRILPGWDPMLNGLALKSTVSIGYPCELDFRDGSSGQAMVIGLYNVEAEYEATKVLSDYDDGRWGCHPGKQWGYHAGPLGAVARWEGLCEKQIRRRSRTRSGPSMPGTQRADGLYTVNVWTPLQAAGYDPMEIMRRAVEKARPVIERGLLNAVFEPEGGGTQ